jgi:transcriptional regulator SbtR-like protein
MTGIGEQLITKAREAGALRQNATGTDLFALMNAAAWISEQMSKEQADRLVDLMMSGLLTATT